MVMRRALAVTPPLPGPFAIYDLAKGNDVIPPDMAAAVIDAVVNRPVAHVSRATDRECMDPLARLLSDAGWTGRQNSVAWAVVMRESNGQPTTWSGGAAGLFQLQASVWSDSSWWDWDKVFDPVANAGMARIVYRSSSWRPWGLTPDGTAIDGSDYDGWSDAEKDKWIWQPYIAWKEKYPC